MPGISVKTAQENKKEIFFKLIEIEKTLQSVENTQTFIAAAMEINAELSHLQKLCSLISDDDIVLNAYDKQIAIDAQKLLNTLDSYHKDFGVNCSALKDLLLNISHRFQKIQPVSSTQQVLQTLSPKPKATNEALTKALAALKQVDEELVRLWKINTESPYAEGRYILISKFVSDVFDKIVNELKKNEKQSQQIAALLHIITAELETLANRRQNQAYPNNLLTGAHLGQIVKIIDQFIKQYANHPQVLQQFENILVRLKDSLEEKPMVEAEQSSIAPQSPVIISIKKIEQNLGITPDPIKSEKNEDLMNDFEVVNGNQPLKRNTSLQDLTALDRAFGGLSEVITSTRFVRSTGQAFFNQAAKWWGGSAAEPVANKTRKPGQ